MDARREDRSGLFVTFMDDFAFRNLQGAGGRPDVSIADIDFWARKTAGNVTRPVLEVRPSASESLHAPAGDGGGCSLISASPSLDVPAISCFRFSMIGAERCGDFRYGEPDTSLCCFINGECARRGEGLLLRLGTTAELVGVTQEDSNVNFGGDCRTVAACDASFACSPCFGTATSFDDSGWSDFGAASFSASD